MRIATYRSRNGKVMAMHLVECQVQWNWNRSDGVLASTVAGWRAVLIDANGQDKGEVTRGVDMFATRTRALSILDDAGTLTLDMPAVS